jgi:predicted Zn-dependent protease
MRKSAGLALLVAMVCGAGNLPAQEMIDGFRTCKNAYTREQETELGGKVAAEIYKQQPVLKNSDPVSRYVQQLGDKLVASALDSRWSFNFHVVDSDAINAFALPGGAIFVNLATVTAAENEAQLAGVMAHEISHVVLRHSTCNLTKQQRRSLFYGLGQAVAGIALGGAAGSLASSGIGYAAGLSFLRMSREAEKEADLMGVQILYDAGYDPRGMPQFFETIQAKYGAGGAQMLSDHPNPGNRTEYVTARIATFPTRADAVRTTPEFKRIHAIAAARAPLTPAAMEKGEWKTSSAYAHAPQE